MIWIISGPTSAGKSTFIDSARSAEITGLPRGTPVIWATSDKLADHLGQTNLLLHYNILRPLQKLRQLARRGGRGEIIAGRLGEFDQDPAWTKILEHDAPKTAVVLVAGKQTIVERIRKRNAIGDANPSKLYPHQKWEGLLEQVDLPGLYRAWCQELRNHHIPYLLIDSSNTSFMVIEDEERLPDILNDDKPIGGSHELRPESVDDEATTYSREQIAQLLRERRFGYHRIELPYGMHTRGQDRSETRDLVLPESLIGKSVLDVGCALGYFCFEAEARGAQRVVGVDVREERLRNALLLKDIKQSEVEFLHRDVVLDPLDEVFDHVLLLNVVHHLHEPVRVIRQVASITGERLVIEFPTLADPKFQASLDAELPPGYAAFPIIGVSSMGPNVGQTFVFSPAGMERILMDHDALFDRVEFADSPMPGRAIAFAYKDHREREPADDSQGRKSRGRDGAREKHRRRNVDSS